MKKSTNLLYFYSSAQTAVEILGAIAQVPDLGCAREEGDTYATSRLAFICRQWIADRKNSSDPEATNRAAAEKVSLRHANRQLEQNAQQLRDELDRWKKRAEQYDIELTKITGQIDTLTIERDAAISELATLEQELTVWKTRATKAVPMLERCMQFLSPRVTNDRNPLHIGRGPLTCEVGNYLADYANWSTGVNASGESLYRPPSPKGGEG